MKTRNILPRVLLTTLIFFMMIALVHPVRVNAETLLQETFNSIELSVWATTATVDGTVNRVTSPVRSGQYSLRSSIENSTVTATRRAYLLAYYSTVSEAPSDLFMKVHFFIPDDFEHQQPGGAATFAQLARTTIGGVCRLGFINRAGELYLHATVANEHGSTPLQRNTWYSAELEYSTTDGLIRVYLNGEMEIESTGHDGLLAVNEIRLGWDIWIPNISGPIILDDVVVSEERMPFNPKEIYLLHAPFFGRIGQKIIVTLAGHEPGDQFQVVLTGDNGYHAIVDNRAGNVPGVFSFSVDMRNLSRGNYTLSTRLSDSDGNILDEVLRAWEKPYDGLPVTGIDENSAVCVHGEPRFFINSYGLRIGSVPLWKSRDFVNTLWANAWYPEPNLGSYLKYLQLAQDNDFAVIGPVNDRSWEGQHASGVRYPNAAEIAAYVNAVRDDDTHLMYNWMDEPVTNHSTIGVNREGTIAMVQEWTRVTHELDPRRLVATSEWATEESLHNNVTRSIMLPNLTADVYSYDYYPIEFASGEFRGRTMEIYARIAEVYYNWNEGLVPFFAWVETADVRPEGSLDDFTQYPPTPEQVRMLCWIPIVYGAKGLNWYHYQGHVPPGNLAAMNEMVRLADLYGQIIIGPDTNSFSVTHDANQKSRRVETMVKETATDYYIFAVRVTEASGPWVDPRESEEIAVSFQLNGGPSDGIVYDMLTPHQAVHQTFDTAQAGGEFMISLSEVPVIPGSLILGGGYRSEASDIGYPTMWHIVYDDGQGNLLPSDIGVNSRGSIDYSTGEVRVTFHGDIDTGEEKIHVGYQPDNRHHNLTLSNSSFTDSFEHCGVRIYRIPKGDIDYYTITLSTQPIASGTTSGEGTFQPGTAVTVTATANTGYRFLNWTEEGRVVSTEPAYTFTAHSDRDLTANFHIGTFVEISSGWNWLSFNVLPHDLSLPRFFPSVEGNILQVRTQSQSAFYTGSNWMGDLVSMEGIASGQMYKVYAADSCVLPLQGSPLAPTDPISLTAGWNWVAYYPDRSMGISAALGSIVSEVEQARSQNQSAVFNSVWIGDLTQLDPGQGYILYLNRASTLIYPQ